MSLAPAQLDGPRYRRDVMPLHRVCAVRGHGAHLGFWVLCLARSRACGGPRRAARHGACAYARLGTPIALVSPRLPLHVLVHRSVGLPYDATGSCASGPAASAPLAENPEQETRLYHRELWCSRPQMPCAYFGGLACTGSSVEGPPLNIRCKNVPRNSSVRRSSCSWHSAAGDCSPDTSRLSRKLVRSIPANVPEKRAGEEQGCKNLGQTATNLRSRGYAWATSTTRDDPTARDDYETLDAVRAIHIRPMDLNQCGNTYRPCAH